ncbi:MAG: putative Ig domain-containing protein [Acidobacteria bacterium]|nr:putative Ig domain-containing protein [Acidobacteriota bacterium]
MRSIARNALTWLWVAMAGPVFAQRALTITTPSLPAGTVGVAYLVALMADGGLTPRTWAVTSGALPVGVSLDGGTGILNGIPQTTIGSPYNFVVEVTDSLGVRATRPFTITISQSGAGGLTIQQTSLPNASIGAPYSTALTASGGTPPYTWSIIGIAPQGLVLSATTGVFSGTATVPGTYEFTVRVQDAAGGSATRQFTMTVLASAGFSIATTTIPNGVVGVPYSFTLAAQGGTAPLTWSVTGGQLPPGIGPITNTGQLTGTPTIAGSYNFTVQLTDAIRATTSRTFTMAINSPAFSISTSTLPNAATGAPYNQTLSASGGAPPLQWTTSLGSLPPGLALNQATGVISGTPSAGGSYTFTVRVQDATGASATRQFTLIVVEGLIITTATALPAASEGIAYSQTLIASGGTPPYVWSLSIGSLPAGLALTPAGGVISGTPTAIGSYSFIVQVTDAVQQTATKAFTLVVSGRLVILTPSPLPNAIVRLPYSETLAASGGAPPYAWTLASGGTPPLGVVVNPNGVISGTPVAAGLFNFTVVVTDSQNATATKALAMTVVPGLSITTTSLPAATAGVQYAQTLAATGGQAPYSWSLTSGSLPSGLTLNASGVISGTPQAAGSFNLTVQVADSRAAVASLALTLVVLLPAAPSVVITGLPPDVVQPAQQPRLSVAAGALYPVPINATMTLSFTSDAAVPADDPAIAFSTGGRTIDFVIPANSTQAQLPQGFGMQTGTVSGSITLAVTLRAQGQNITPSPAPVVSRVSRAAPVLGGVQARRVPGGLEVVIVAYATSREVTAGRFQFTPSPGSSLQTTELTVQLGDGARRWYESEQSRQFGSQFTLTQQFNVQGDASAIASVGVTLTNSQGASQAVTANFN